MHLLQSMELDICEGMNLQLTSDKTEPFANIEFRLLMSVQMQCQQLGKSEVGPGL